MDLSRRAQTPTPIPENRRITDLYRQITTAAYGTPVALVIGQQRVPSTLIRDGRTAAQNGRENIPLGERGQMMYGLCEGPVVGIPKEYTNNNGIVNPGYTPGESAHLLLPIPHVSIDPPKGDDGKIDMAASPDDLSFEVSSDIPISGNAQGAYIQSVSDGAAASHEDVVGLPYLLASDFHVCVSGTDAASKQWMVRYDRSTNSISLRSRVLRGSWSGDTPICNGSLNSSLRPDGTSGMVQPRIAASGDKVHIIWSVLSDASGAVHVAHIWSNDSGATWTVGQSLSRPVMSGTNGVRSLQLALHSSGEVWVSFHRHGDLSVNTNYPSSGSVVGFLPSTATTSTAWILPSMNSGRLTPTPVRSPKVDGELLITDSSLWSVLWATVATTAKYRLKAPSILPLGSGKALFAATFSHEKSSTPLQLVCVPIIADIEVKWDLPSDAFSFGGVTASHNIASIAWLNANGFPSQNLGRTPNSDVDNLNDGATQIFSTEDGKFGVLVLSQHFDYAFGSTHAVYRPYMAKGNEYYGKIGTWRLPWGTWNGTSFAWTVGVATSWSKDGFQATAFCNESGQTLVAMGSIDLDASATLVDHRSQKLSLSSLYHSQTTASSLFEYAPATAQNSSLMYQLWAQDNAILTSIREDELLDGTYAVGIREVTRFDGFGDVLPSVICKRLLANDTNLRGLNIKNVVFDPVTWGQFDNYCQAMGIKFSLVLTSQQAAWPLVCDILESANAMPYRSEGMIKVYVRETASITANGATFDPIWNASSSLTIPEGDYRDGVHVDVPGSDALWNSLRVNWKNRARNYADEPYQIENAGSVARKGRIAASSSDWHWICDPKVVAVCAWLRMRQQQRAPRTYRFELSQKYMLLEDSDIIAISWGTTIPARFVRILSIEEGDADWRVIDAEDAPIASAVIAPPQGGSGSTEPIVIQYRPVNMPIIFVANIGGELQPKIWCLLSWPYPVSGCDVYQSWDGTTYAKVGTCTTKSPTGILTEDMAILRARPGLRVHPGLRAGGSDFAVGDYSESGLVPPYPDWNGYLNASIGSLLWIDGEIVSYAIESDDGSVDATCSVFQRGRYGTTAGPHPVNSRIGAITNSAWSIPVASSHSGQTCYFKFPTYGQGIASAATYTVEIP